MYIADLHIHSHYSRATSRDCTPEFLDLWARRKGIDIIGTGDFTHPAWREELKEKLAPAEEGLYVLKEEYRLKDPLALSGKQPRFVVTGEISSIYKKDGKVRKVHSLILLPNLEAAVLLSHKLETIGNIHSDGRPILGLDCHDLLEIILELCPGAVYVPAHIWTPHFSLFGAFSGFDSIKDCFGDLTSHIHALETGLSSDPPMNWRISALDSFQLISNSDAHSPGKLGREANLLSIDLSYPGLAAAIETGKGLMGTIEFFPEEGKYHFDGHRKCHLCLSPTEAAGYSDRCPVCGKKLTIGVMHRVEQLADRPEDYIKPEAKPFESLVPLMEVIAASTGRTPASKKVQSQYESMLGKLGPEFSILRDVPLEDIRKKAGFLVAGGIEKLRNGDVERSPGFDGEYGTIKLLDDSHIFALEGQLSLFTEEQLTAAAAVPGTSVKKETACSSSLENDTEEKPVSEEDGLHKLPSSLNEEQLAAVQAVFPAVAVIAGPGTGKTKTLVSRILYLIKERGVKPSEITAVTFTNQAAIEMKTRLGQELKGKRAVGLMNIGTFHSICYHFLQKHLPDFTLADEFETAETAMEIIRRYDLSLTARRFLKELSLLKSGIRETSNLLPPEAARDYQEQLSRMKVLDFDDLLLETIRLLEQEKKTELRGQRYHYLLIDEFQDISPVQQRLVKAWNRNSLELFVIGDPDQAIYGFRGADSDCFARLEETCPDLHTIRLTRNYRSVPEIIACSNGVISNNPGSGRLLAAVSKNSSPVRIIHAAGELSEAIFIAHEINRLIGGIDMVDTEQRSGLPESSQMRSFSDIAVLYRTHRQAEQLEYCLKKEGIPYVVAGRDDFLGEPTVRGTVAFFRYLADPLNRPALRSCLRLIWNVTEEDGRELITGMTAAWKPKLSRQAPKKVLEAWMAEQKLSDDKPLQKLCQMSLFYKTMNEFLTALTFGLEGDLKRCAGKTYTADAVTLSTLHGSKGLEYPVVFLYGMRKGLMPLTLNGLETDLEEERRLFYVGMTRAREELILLTSPEPSPFIEELPEAYLVREKADKRKYADSGKQLSLFDFMQ